MTRYYLRVAVIGAGATLAALLLLRGSVAGGAVAAAISVAAPLAIDWLLGIATGEDQE